MTIKMIRDELAAMLPRFLDADALLPIRVITMSFWARLMPESGVASSSASRVAAQQSCHHMLVSLQVSRDARYMPR